MQQLNATGRNRATRREDVPDFSRVTSVTAIADLLSGFDGCIGNYRNWEKQLQLLRATYRLSDECVKMLIGMRLKGQALEWLHSKPQYIELPVDVLLEEMQEIYDYRPTKIKKTIRRTRLEEERNISSVRTRQSNFGQPSTDQ